MLHVLDVAMNAVSAGARTIRIGVFEAPAEDRLCLYVADDGPGMSAELVERVLTEFATTKQKRAGWVGFGLALLRSTVDLTDGSFTLRSRPGQGTLVTARMAYGHVDRPPLGDVSKTLRALLVGCHSVDVCFTHRLGDRGYRIDTRPVRRAVGEAYDSHTVQQWLLDQVREGEAALADGRAGDEPRGT